MLTHLLRPLVFLRIRHESGTLNGFNWTLPGVVTLACVAVVWLVSPHVNVFHGDGLINKVLAFVQNLPGFYIAALAAVATFARPNLDELMPGRPPTVDIIYNNQLTHVELTRRRFLCMMFSYLTALSIGLTLIAIVVTTFADPIAALLKTSLLPVYAHALQTGLRVVGATLFFWLFMQMVVVTLWGLYYLGERMHTPD